MRAVCLPEGDLEGWRGMGRLVIDGVAPVRGTSADCPAAPFFAVAMPRIPHALTFRSFPA